MGDRNPGIGIGSRDTSPEDEVLASAEPDALLKLLKDAGTENRRHFEHALMTISARLRAKERVFHGVGSLRIFVARLLGAIRDGYFETNMLSGMWKLAQAESTSSHSVADDTRCVRQTIGQSNVDYVLKNRHGFPRAGVTIPARQEDNHQETWSAWETKVQVIMEPCPESTSPSS
jgi:hypothetical protein